MPRRSRHWYVQTTTRVCSYWHDHPAGDPSYDDCEAAAATQRARLARQAQPYHDSSLAKYLCTCDNHTLPEIGS